MFRKLRNHFILINLATTTAILLVAFSAVYLVAKNTSESRRPIPTEVSISVTDSTPSDSSTPTDDNSYFRQVVEERVFADRKVALSSLLLTLIVTGLSVEVLVAFFSYYFAEQAIKPVKEAYESQKIFIANASHEIKTPVAAIKANLEAADLSDENRWIKNIELEADKIENLNLALLRLAKSDLTKEAVTLEEVDLKRTVSSVLRSFDSRLSQKGIVLEPTYSFKKSPSLKLNRSDFKEIVEILLDNAIKYSDKSISLSVSSKSLTLKNDGATIPKEKLPHVFDRFYQVDKSASGSGLGLSIAKSLADRNRWNLSAASDSSSTSFTLSFV